MANSTSNKGKGMDLSALFNAASQALTSNQSTLNEADTLNHDHGDNMVQVFNMISQVMAQNKNAPPSQQLSQASQYLAQNGKSGSAQAYSQGLAQAAQQFQGQSAVTPDNAMLLIQSLLGGGQPQQQQENNPLEALLGGGGTSSSGGGDLLGALLGGSGQPPQGNQQQDGFDMGDLLNAGMAFMNAKQQGQSTLQAGLNALISAGPLGQKPHRQQSGQLVANALLQAFMQKK
ncbi:MAG: hypothetical protein C3F07_14530 [Anaerolineales bacterium]|nr:DAK2 domain-containing protein [Anaerolineae bacterium]PWB71322.1 MAG: hypothetical protein C3F07_14530 [Anaerolineales bacterium]